MKQPHWWLAGWQIFEFEINKKKLWKKEIRRCRWEGDLDYKKRDMQKKIEDKYMNTYIMNMLEKS